MWQEGNDQSIYWWLTGNYANVDSVLSNQLIGNHLWLNRRSFPEAFFNSLVQIKTNTVPISHQWCDSYHAVIEYIDICFLIGSMKSLYAICHFCSNLVNKWQKIYCLPTKLFVRQQNPMLHWYWFSIKVWKFNFGEAC